MMLRCAAYFAAAAAAALCSRRSRGWLVSLLLVQRANGYHLASPMTAHALRLSPGEDLVVSLLDHCEKYQLTSSAVLTVVGSLTNVRLRLAGAQDFLTLEEPLEIISLVGTVCSDREHHLHLSVSRRDGSVLGGHMKGAATIATTGEVILGVMPELRFSREMDAATNYKELQIGRTDM